MVTFFKYKVNFDKFKYPVSADPIRHFMKELDVGNPITFEAWAPQNRQGCVVLLVRYVVLSLVLE